MTNTTNEQNELQNLLDWVAEFGIEEKILDLMGGEIDDVVDFLMVEGFDFNESEKIYEHFSL